MSPRGPDLTPAAQVAARHLAGNRANICAVEPLEAGTANLGLRLFRLEDGQSFVEKRTSSKTEFDIAQAVLADHLAGHEPCPEMVRILHAVEDNGGFLLYMERLEGIGRNEDWHWGSADMLAQSVHALSRYLEALEKRHDLAFEQRDTLGGLPAALAGETEATERLAAMAAALSALPMPLGHNDVFWPNLGLARVPGSFAFLDFALVGRNLPGAEFHHFAQRTKNGTDHQAFFQAVTERYARLLGTPAGLVRCGAYAYAALRAFRRAVRRGREAAGRGTARALFGKAEAALQGAAA